MIIINVKWLVTYGVKRTAVFGMGQLKGASRVSGKILFLDLGDNNKSIHSIKMY